MDKSDDTLKEWQIKWRCRACLDVIYSRSSGEFRSCKCGSIYIDQTPYYSRHGGEPSNFERVDNGDEKTSEE